MTTTGPRIGSLFSGAGGLDLAVLDVLGGTVVWHSQYEPPDKKGRPDKHQYAARILAHHWPQVPNLGDITAVDWDQVLDDHGPVDILIGGFPCTDLSLAGKQAGLAGGTRSGLWLHMARAIKHLQPKLVIIENVRGLLSAPAHSDMERCPWCVGGDGDEPVLRALGCVLGDLAELGFDAEWYGLPASAVGAPHERFRVFVAAWPADTACPGLEDGREGRPGRGTDAAENPDVEPSHQRRLAAPGQAESGRARADLGGRGRVATADAERDGRQGLRGDAGTHQERQAPAVVGRGPARSDLAAAHTEGVRHGHTGTTSIGGLPTAPVAGGAAAEPLGQSDESPADTESNERRVGDGDDVQPRSTAIRRVPAAGRSTAADTGGVGRGPAEPDVQPGQPDADRSTPADTSGVGRREGGAEPARLQWGPDAPVGSGTAWGRFEGAIRRWERVRAVPVPHPVDDRGRLAPRFPEWMMGYAPGWITKVPAAPGMTPAQVRNAQLKAAGNGVVVQQGAAAIDLLLTRIPEAVLRRLFTRTSA